MGASAAENRCGRCGMRGFWFGRKVTLSLPKAVHREPLVFLFEGESTRLDFGRSIHNGVSTEFVG